MAEKQRREDQGLARGGRETPRNEEGPTGSGGNRSHEPQAGPSFQAKLMVTAGTVDVQEGEPRPAERTRLLGKVPSCARGKSSVPAATGHRRVGA